MNASSISARRRRAGNCLISLLPWRSLLLPALALALLSLDASAQPTPGPPIITNQPRSQADVVGTAVSFFVGVAESTTPLRYQWHFNQMNVFDGTNATLWLLNVQTNDAGYYWVTVINSFGPVNSTNATLTVIGPGGEGCVEMPLGGTATQLFDNLGVTNQPNEPFPCDVPGGASRWRCLRPELDGLCVIDTLGSDIDTLLAVYTFTGTNLLEALSPVACDDNGGPDGLSSRVQFPAVRDTSYLVQVDGVDGQQGNITLTWRLGRPPVIVQQPTNIAAPAGGKATFSCIATGKPAPRFQWQFNGTNLPGATNASLMLNHLRPEDAGEYRVVASNFVGVQLSQPATLQVTEPVRLEARGITNNILHLRVTGPPGPSVQYVLEVSTNFLAWLPVATNDAPNGLTLFTAPVNPGPAQRFYRAYQF